MSEAWVLRTTEGACATLVLNRPRFGNAKLFRRRPRLRRSLAHIKSHVRASPCRSRCEQRLMVAFPERSECPLLAPSRRRLAPFSPRATYQTAGEGSKQP